MHILLNGFENRAVLLEVDAVWTAAAALQRRRGRLGLGQIEPLHGVFDALSEEIVV
jgi:hypothetical protein